MTQEPWSLSSSDMAGAGPAGPSPARIPIAPSRIPTSVYEIEPDTVVPSEMSRIVSSKRRWPCRGCPPRCGSAGFDSSSCRGTRVPDHPIFVARGEHPDDEYGGPLENHSTLGPDIL